MVVLALDAVLAALLFVLWSLAVGFARVALGVHFLFDILAGYLLGLAIGLVLWLLDRPGHARTCLSSPGGRPGTLAPRRPAA